MGGTLRIQLLGDLSVVREDKLALLPPSKKARAILAYLVLCPRDHKRQRLTELLWDVADDPRASLRWVLSRLRAVVDDEAATRIVATREAVRFEAAGAAIDVVHLRERLAADLNLATPGELWELEAAFHGELLEGLEFPEYFDFQAWLTAEREELRAAHVALLQALVQALEDDVEERVRALRKLLSVDPLNASARAALISGLYQLRRRDEAKEVHRLGVRLFAELGEPCPPVLSDALSAARRCGTSEAPEATAQSLHHEALGQPVPSSLVSGEESVPLSTRRVPALPLIGRGELLGQLTRRLQDGSPMPILLLGEPGVGKSRLLFELEEWAERSGFCVTSGRAQEAELARPYGPWLDALRRLARNSSSERVTQRLLSELSGATGQDATRDALFAGLSSLLQGESRNRPVLFVLDDVHWCDDASLALLSYVIRTCDRERVTLLLASRDGELVDNTGFHRLVLNLRRKNWLFEVEVGRLDEEGTRQLVHAALERETGASGALPGSQGPLARADQVIEGAFRKSAGNPLFALEWARGAGATSANLRGVVAERLGRLPPDALSLIRWASIFGAKVSLERLTAPLNRSATELYEALEVAERLSILVPSEDGYAFSHDILRSVVYSEISAPRRRLMHHKVAQTLRPLVQRDPSVAGELAHHAVLGGDAQLAAEACVTSGERCLRLFANRQAEWIARTGLHHARDLADELRVPLTIELLEVSFRARRPESPAEFESELLDLGSRALGLGLGRHARLAYKALSYLRWEGGNWPGAAQMTKEVSQVSRADTAPERVESLAEAARCLAILERDLGEADALLLEAAGLAARHELDAAPLDDAQGLLCQHRGELAQAAELFKSATRIARARGDSILEFDARSHSALLEIQRGDLVALERQLEPLERLADKFREGSERPFVGALRAFCAYAANQATSQVTSGADAAHDSQAAPQKSADREAQRVELMEQLQALRTADAKYRLVALLGRLAAHDLAQGDLASAEAKALEALQVAAILERPSEQALAQLILAEVRLAQKDLAGAQQRLLLAQALAPRASAEVRERTEQVSRACAQTHDKPAPAAARTSR